MRPALPSRLILARLSSEWRYWTRRHPYDLALYALYRRHVPHNYDSPRAREHWGVAEDAPIAMVYPDD